MSQLWIKGTSGGGGGGTGILTITGDTGGAVGADGANNINLLTGIGLTTSGAPLSNTVTISRDNYRQGSGTTTGVQTLDLITIPMGGVPGVYTVDAMIAGYNITTLEAGIGYTIVGAARTPGFSPGVLLVHQAVDSFEEATTANCEGRLVVSGNNLILQVVGAGILPPLTISWRAELSYVFVS